MAQQLDLVNDTALRTDYPAAASTVLRQPMHSGSSTDGAGGRHGDVHSGSSTDRNVDTASSTDIDIEDVERLRVARGLSHARMCALAGVELNNYFKLRRGRHRPSAATLRKLAAALADPVPARPPRVIAAFHRVCFALAADALGLDRAAVLATDFTVTRRTDAWIAAARARMVAVYVTAVELEVDNTELARALGLTRQAIKKARDKVEDLRDDAGVDAAIETVCRQVRG
jgi:transcriptional regulator with XRE-family HTH domain